MANVPNSPATMKQIAQTTIWAKCPTSKIMMSMMLARELRHTWAPIARRGEEHADQLHPHAGRDPLHHEGAHGHAEADEDDEHGRGPPRDRLATDLRRPEASLVDLQGLDL
jgi:hypothetical protein